MIDLHDAPKLLALDTSTQQAAVALVAGSSRIFTARPDPEARHGRVLIPTIARLMSKAGLKTEDLDGFVVGLGPGSYTGLSIGLTAAKTFAFVEQKPLATFDSLELIAGNAPSDALRVAVIADAQRGDVYAATFAREAAGLPLVQVEPTAIRPFQEWAETLTPETLVLGPAAVSPNFSEGIPEFARRPENPDDHWPSGEALAHLAVEVWESGVRAEPWFLEPAYFRRSAAEEQWEKRKNR